MASPKIKLLKRIFIYLSIYFFVFSKPQKQHLDKEKEYLINYLGRFVNLKEKPLNSNDSLMLEEKENILKYISTTINKNISSIKSIIYKTGANFGNILLCLNKLIFFCEIIGCTEITLQNKAFWFIKNSIYLKDYNITINSIEDSQPNYPENTGVLNSDTIYYDSFDVFFYFYKIKPKIMIHLLREEIVNNLPKVNISQKDLYIHIRSGDIFVNVLNKPYAQPPLCFYISILKKFNFDKVYLISEDRFNPTIDKLIGKFRNIIYSKNNLKYDLSCLMNSFNLVASISSFLNTIIILNSNLKYLYEYNIYQMKQKLIQYHYDLFEFPKSFTIYRMEATKNYKTKMYIWKNNKMQRKLMIKEKCVNYFTIVRNRI